MKRLISYLDIRRFSRKLKIQFCINVVVGTFIVLVFHLMERTDWGENTLNSGLDFFISREAKKEAKNKQRKEQIFFIDIDQETFIKWGESLLTPRDKIAKIIEYAYKGGAKVIVIDILLESRDCCNAPGDEKLRNTLEKITKEKASMKIIFPVRVDHEGKIKRNLFDDLIDKNPHFYRAIPSIAATAGDLVNRYWVTHKIAKNSKNEDTLLWGTPLLTVALSERKMNEMDRIEGSILKNYSRKDNGKKKYAYKITLNNKKHLTIFLKNVNLYTQRIRYFLVPPDLNDYESNLLLNRRTAIHLKEPSDMAAKKRFYEDFEDKIIIIGNSHPDVGDIHPTPIGYMPGMYIIGNSIYSILKGRQLNPTPLWLNLIMEIVVIVIAAYIFLFFTSFLSMILATVVIILIFAPLSYYFFINNGVFLNFVFPIIVMGFLETISDIREAFGI